MIRLNDKGHSLFRVETYCEHTLVNSARSSVQPVQYKVVATDVEDAIRVVRVLAIGRTAVTTNGEPTYKITSLTVREVSCIGRVDGVSLAACMTEAGAGAVVSLKALIESAKTAGFAISEADPQEPVPGE